VYNQILKEIKMYLERKRRE